MNHAKPSVRLEIGAAIDGIWRHPGRVEVDERGPPWRRPELADGRPAGVHGEAGAGRILPFVIGGGSGHGGDQEQGGQGGAAAARRTRRAIR